MIMYMYSIYDCAADEYGPVFEAKNDNVAIRKCKMEFKGFPNLGDYELHCVGQFDHSVGCVVVDASQAQIASCLCSLDELFNEESN